MVEPMNADKHRVLLGWLFESVAMLLAVFIAFTWKRVFGPDAPPGEAEVIMYAIAMAGLFALVGLTLLLNLRRSYWICLPFAIVILMDFPLGTALGGYYIWYFWTFRPNMADSRGDESGGG